MELGTHTLRVLDGKYRGRFLQSTASGKARPTARRLREALFSIFSFRIAGARFLDLCAGSGAVGIEALSRGAKHVTFVDRSPKMCSFIEANLEACDVPEDDVEIWLSDAEHFLRRMTMQRGAPWDIAFFDPPYAVDYAPLLDAFSEGELLKRKGVLVVEHHFEKQLAENQGRLHRWRTIKQGNSCLSFYELR